ncbi:ABC transporter ATP-binding protein [Cutibacterium acnes]|uniref:ABC transporter ATP-binding protein n=1 Tax=Cutibacterium acnes TaxID=1747 RepID=UPI00254CA636|nr:ABC transporter ATP-binding protein [Cutibacterium acnes]
MIEGLTKRFGPKVAVDNLTMWVPRGSMFGFVGPNGAGKTTTLSMVTGLLRPDAGRVEVLGHDVWADPAAAKAQMGVLPDGMKTFDRLSGRELLRFCGMLHRLDEATINERAEGLLDALSLTSAADLLVCDYSAGMTKKIDLACAIIADPAVLVLDEPLESVDLLSGQTIRSILRRFVDGGGTVVISSHVMELVESLCDSVAVIAGGRLHAIGALDDVCQGKSLQNRFVELVGGNANMGEGLTWLRRS